MLDAKKVAERVRAAMDGAEPRITGSALAKECKVTPQAVSGWRKNGRVHKRHLQKIAELTGKPLEYFLEETYPQGKRNGDEKSNESFATVRRAWQDASEDQRAMILTVAETILERNAKRKGRRAV